MKKLLVCEKPIVSKSYKAAFDLQIEFDCLHTGSMGIVRNKLMKINFEDIPCTCVPAPVVLTESLNGTVIPSYVSITLGENAQCFPRGSSTSELHEALSSLRAKVSSGYYDEIVLAYDPDERGCWTAFMAIGLLAPDTNIKLTCIENNSLSEDNVVSGFANRTPFTHPAHLSKFMTMVSCQEVKICFDYWWNTNSALVFGELCNWSGLSSHQVVSKFELLLMQDLALDDDLTVYSNHSILTRMAKWKGSGKYANHENGQLGSPSSFASIIKQMVERGFLESISHSYDFSESYRVTEQGRKFCSHLHPRTYDTDLPHRLKIWMDDHDLESVIRYINKIFGRQFKYQRSLSLLK